MTANTHTPDLLRGERIFLSASVPTSDSEYERIADASHIIEGAVVAMTRAILAYGGEIVFGAHPSISPLVSSVAAEYFPVGDRPRVIVYQSRAYERVVPDETWAMSRLGYAKIIWTDAQDGEWFNPEQPKVRCEGSLKFMRQSLLREFRPTSMLAIGGMKGVMDEAEMFDAADAGSLRPKVIYAAERTGGAALALASQAQKFRSSVVLLERSLPALRNPQDDDLAVDPRMREFFPYGAAAEWMVRDIAERKGHAE